MSKTNLFDMKKDKLEIPTSAKTYVLDCKKISYENNNLIMEIPYTEQLQNEQDKQNVRDGIMDLEEQYNLTITALSSQLLSTDLGKQLHLHSKVYNSIKETKRMLYSALGKKQEINLLFTKEILESDLVKRYPSLADLLHQTIYKYSIVGMGVTTLINNIEDSYPKDKYDLQVAVSSNNGNDSSIVTVTVFKSAYNNSVEQFISETKLKIEDRIKQTILPHKLASLALDKDTVDAIVADIYLNSTIENLDNISISLNPTVLNGNYGNPRFMCNFDVTFNTPLYELNNHNMVSTVFLDNNSLSFAKLVSEFDKEIKKEQEWLSDTQQEQKVEQTIADNLITDNSSSIIEEISTELTLSKGIYTKCVAKVSEEENVIELEYNYNTDELKDVAIKIIFDTEFHSINVEILDNPNFVINELMVNLNFDFNTVRFIELKHIFASIIGELEPYLKDIISN